MIVFYYELVKKLCRKTFAYKKPLNIYIYRLNFSNSKFN